MFLKKYRYIILVGVLLLVCLFLAYTFFAVKDTKQHSSKKEVVEEPSLVDDLQKGESEIVSAAHLSVDLLDKSKDGRVIYQLIVKNKADEGATLVYSSSQKYEFEIIDSNDSVIHTYSTGNSFDTKAEEALLEGGKSFKYDVDVTDALETLPDGNYTLSFWVTSDKTSDLKTSITYNKKSTDISKEPQTEEVIFSHMSEEGNYFEAFADKGVQNVYYVEAGIKPFFTEEIKQGTRLKIKYTYIGNHRMVTEVQLAFKE